MTQRTTSSRQLAGHSPVHGDARVLDGEFPRLDRDVSVAHARPQGRSDDTRVTWLKLRPYVLLTQPSPACSSTVGLGSIRSRMPFQRS